MLILVGKSPAVLARDYPDPSVGVLISPRLNTLAMKAADEGMAWAADNDCYNGGLDKGMYRKMLMESRPAKGCLFVCAPDVVGDSAATLQLWDDWYMRIAEFGYPVALVTQDGMTVDDIPWVQADAIFIGGTDDWKLSDASRAIVDEGKRLGKWLHMGRVNSVKRLTTAMEWGMDSVDGSGTSRFTDQHLPRQLRAIASFT